ncbi:SRPBCC family protein [Streptomyces sp. IBSBF 2806]|uniref:SRPBCC family protein n=1 Tax=Streptomyces sp. IBSBF 2806 TaxID=2903529 RepID=UPI002FDC084F
MPLIQATTDLAGVHPDEAWTVLKKGEAVASRAEHVRSVEPLPARGDGARRTAWRVLLNGSEITWSQREFAEPGPRLRFEQVTGDLQELSGDWSVTEVPGGSRVALTVDFHLGVDGLAPLLDPIWAQSFQAHADALLRALTAAVREESP